MKKYLLIGLISLICTNSYAIRWPIVKTVIGAGLSIVSVASASEAAKCFSSDNDGAEIPLTIAGVFYSGVSIVTGVPAAILLISGIPGWRALRVAQAVKKQTPKKLVIN